MSDAPNTEQIVDVWSRTARKYRIRAVIMLVVLGTLFAGLCCFTFWLRTGEFVPWRHGGYWSLMTQSFVPVGAKQITLSDFLSSPIPVQEVPIHAVIMGLQFASLCSVPILVTILYRLPVATLFAAMVFFLAAMPWLGLSIFAGCVLTRTGLVRFSFRYASALCGLIPIAAYFVMASWEPAGSPSKIVHQRALIYAPWVLALLGSCVICALAIAIAKLIDYRPGGIPPVLAMLFITPVWLFNTYVGRDELAYRLLVRQIGPGASSVFAPVDVGAMAHEQTIAEWKDSSGQPYEDIYRSILEKKRDDVLLTAEQDRQAAIERCSRFIEQFPTSRYIPYVLFLKGRALDCRVNEIRLNGESRVEFRFDLPGAASRRTWRTLLDHYPHIDVSLMSLLNLAILAAEDGDFDKAIDRLDQIVRRVEAAHAVTPPADGDATIVDSVFTRASPLAGLGIDQTALADRARMIREMLFACRSDAPRPAREVFAPRAQEADAPVHPAAVLMSLDDSSSYYRLNLEGLLATFPDSNTAGYVRVRLAQMEPARSRRIQRLRALADSLAGRPAGAEARFALADALQEDSLLEEARSALDGLVAAHPASVWAEAGRKRLTALSVLQSSQ